jgi:sulfotransferase
MNNGLHFISGLPRSGSTVLAALLRQNPHFHTGITSPVGSIFNAILRETSQRNEASILLDDAARARLLRGCFGAVYHDVTQTVFDTNRIWTGKLGALAELFPAAKVICCVRNPAWIVDSIERLLQRNPLELSGIFDFDPQMSVYARAEGLGGERGLLGAPWRALREAVYGPHADRLLLVRYETLVRHPAAALMAIYAHLGESLFEHDAERIEPFDTEAFDRRLGMPGLHTTGRKLVETERTTVLPPDLFAKLHTEAWWEEPTAIPAGVLVV